jgi:hypothetical protein
MAHGRPCLAGLFIQILILTIEIHCPSPRQKHPVRTVHVAAGAAPGI